MIEKLKKVNKLIEQSNKIPNDIKEIVKAICRGYIRESNGKIPISGIENVCKTNFNKIDENNKEFSGEEQIFATTTTDYDDECNVIHTVSYLNSNNYIKLIAILTHELGHVITEPKPCEIKTTDEGIEYYPLAKRTNTYYQTCYYRNGELIAHRINGFRIADGFLESICSKIWSSKEFREELLQNGYNLQNFIYKDERIFSSRVYDEYKACFELFDYIMDGDLFDFACQTFSSNQDMVDFINNKKINIIYSVLDKSNDALWNLKKFEDKEPTDEFLTALDDYNNKKQTSIAFADELMDFLGKSCDDKKYLELIDIYNATLQKQKLLPLPENSQRRL